MSNDENQGSNGPDAQSAMQNYDVVYLYYMKEVSPDHWDPHVYKFSRNPATPLSQAEIITLVATAENDTPVCYKIEDLPWRHASYAVFVARRAPRPWHVVFIYKGAGGGNHNFRRANAISGAGDLSGEWFENRRLRKEGGPLGHKTEVFHVKFPGLNRSTDHAGHGALKVLARTILKLIGLEPKSHNEQGSNIGP